MYGRFFRHLIPFSIQAGREATSTCGISPSKQGYAAISDGYRKAVMAHKVATLHGENCVAYSDMGIYKLLVHIKDTSVLHEIYDETLGTLEEFDSANGTDYMETLKCYLENDSSVQEVTKRYIRSPQYSKLQAEKDKGDTGL